MASSICWGIEIGAAAIKAIKLEAVGDGNVKVLDFAVIQHPKVLSTPGVDANDVLRVSLGALTSQYDLSKAAIAVSVPGHSAFARFAKLPPVEPKKVPDIVKFEAMQQIPFPLDNVEWDYQTFISPDSPDVEVGIFAITREKVNERLQMLADVGLKPNYVVLSPIAVYNALAYDLNFDSKTPGTIIVDVGTTSTDLVIATPGRMWIRTFHTGGHQFTDALVNQFQLSYPKAEKLKKEAEDTKHARQVFQALRPVFTDLTQEIQRSIGYYQSINKEANLTRLIGVGSTFLLPGLRKYLKQQLSMDVYRVDAQTPFKRATIEGDKAALFNDLSTTMVTAYGLALQGLGLNAVGGNLMPTAVIRKAMWKEKVPWFGLAAGIAGLASAVMFVRPVKNHFEVQARITDPIVQSTINKGNQLKQDAEAAGVLASGEADLRAANMVSLTDHKAIYEKIATDLSSLFAFSDSKIDAHRTSIGATGPAIPPPAYSLTVLNTTYMPGTGAAAATDPNAAPMPPEYGGAPTDPNAAFHRVKCEMILSTSQPEPQRLWRPTITAWFEANKKRDGVPYELVLDQPVLRAVDAPLAAAGPETGARPPLPGERGERGARGATAPRPPRVLASGGGPAAPRSSGGSGEADTLLKNLAPIEAPADAGPPTTATITVTFWAVFKPEAPAAGAEGGAN